MDIVLSDIEGTVTTGSSWRALGRYLIKHGRGWAYSLFILRWLPRFPFVKMGLVDQRKGMNAWMQDEISLLAGKTRGEIGEIADWIVRNEMWPKRRPDVIRDLSQHRSSGAKIVLVSSAYQPFAEAFARYLETEAIGTGLLYHQDRLSGLSLPVNAYQQKADKVRSLYKGKAFIAAYGDTASDIPMMRLSQEPIAVYPDQRLREEVISRGWRILDDHKKR
jgi:HAD superfamily phosphoserine phosphatase-like hydrolase